MIRVFADDLPEVGEVWSAPSAEAHHLVRVRRVQIDEAVVGVIQSVLRLAGNFRVLPGGRIGDEDPSPDGTGIADSIVGGKRNELSIVADGRLVAHVFPRAVNQCRLQFERQAIKFVGG